MPLPLVPLIAAGASLLGQGVNAITQGGANRKNREFTEHMYNRQKSDNIDMWNMQNSYNSPQQQMARLQEAGLNPNLVYGNGSAANTAGSVSTPHAQPYKASAPQFDLGTTVDKYFNTQMAQTQLSNQQKQGNLLALEESLKKLEIQKSSFENQFANDTLHIKRQLFADTANQKHYQYNNEMKRFEMADQIAQNLALTGQAIGLDNQKRGVDIKNRQMDFNMKESQQGLKKWGLDTNAPWYVKFITQMLNNNTKYK